MIIKEGKGLYYIVELKLSEKPPVWFLTCSPLKQFPK